MRKQTEIRHRARRSAVLVLTVAIAFGATAGLSSATGAAGGREAHRTRVQSTTAPPKPLLIIEEQAEDIIDRVPGKRWARVAADIAATKAAWAAFQRRAQADGIASTQLDDFDTALGRLTAAAKAKNITDTLQAANDVSGATVELFGNYDLGHPLPIARLDIIGRQIGFDLNTAPDEVQSQIDEARAQWEAIRDEVTARSSAVAAQVDATLAALDEANASNNTGLLKAEVRVLLEAVDAMEELYG